MLYLPPDYACIKVVGSFRELVETRFADGVNALCWSRTLPGDFREIAEQLAGGDGIVALDREILDSLTLSAEGRIAAEVMLEDLRMLADHGLAPELNCIHGYPRDEEPAAIATDVYSFHADSAPVETDTYLCTYFGASSEGLRNEDARRYIDLAETRARLLIEFGGEDGDAFREFLQENAYDLHYLPNPDALPYSFGIGNLWRVAVDYPGCPVPPCIHRAPITSPGDLPRLLLIS